MADRTLSKYLDKVCEHCGEYFEVYRDPDGIWVECACSAGYLS
jgi:hypothetical protein